MARAELSIYPFVTQRPGPHVASALIGAAGEPGRRGDGAPARGPE